jgi:Holliday junction resolvase
MLVALDLIRKGFEIYRHLSDMAPCDMVASKEGKLLRVEVKYVGGEYSQRV